MQAIRVHRFGSPDLLELEDIPTPIPGDGEVLIRVHAAGVGPWDAWIRAGKSVIEQPLPLTPGADVSGEILAFGKSVSSFSPGQLVFGATNKRFTGGYAEQAIADSSMIAPKPGALTHIEAASVPVVAVTALQMLFRHAGVRAGQRVLVHGAGGSVGTFAVQLARRAGAEVIATDVTVALDFVRSLGAAQVVDVLREQFDAVVAPVDVVIDTVGGETQARSLSVLKPRGILVSSVSQPDPARARELGVTGRFMLVEVDSASLVELATLLEAGELRTRVGTVLPLAGARMAHEMLEGSVYRAPGKIVLELGQGRGKSRPG